MFDHIGITAKDLEAGLRFHDGSNGEPVCRKEPG